MRKSEFKDTTMDFYATSRMVAKAEFSKVTSNTTAKAWEKAGHKLLKVKFMTVDIRSTEHPAPRRAML